MGSGVSGARESLKQQVLLLNKSLVRHGRGKLGVPGIKIGRQIVTAPDFRVLIGREKEWSKTAHKARMEIRTHESTNTTKERRSLPATCFCLLLFPRRLLPLLGPYFPNVSYSNILTFIFLSLVHASARFQGFILFRGESGTVFSFFPFFVHSMVRMHAQLYEFPSYPRFVSFLTACAFLHPLGNRFWFSLFSTGCFAADPGECVRRHGNRRAANPQKRDTPESNPELATGILRLLGLGSRGLRGCSSEIAACPPIGVSGMECISASAGGALINWTSLSFCVMWTGWRSLRSFLARDWPGEGDRRALFYTSRVTPQRASPVLCR